MKYIIIALFAVTVYAQDSTITVDSLIKSFDIKIIELKKIVIQLDRDIKIKQGQLLRAYGSLQTLRALKDEFEY